MDGVWSFLFPSDVWTPIGDFLGSTAASAIALLMVLGMFYLGLLYLDTTKGIEGAWNPWVIFWAIVTTSIVILIVMWCTGTVNIGGTEVVTFAPHTCIGDHDQEEAGLCYKKCRDGFHGSATSCYANSVEIGVGTVVGLESCPNGWTNMGLTCSRWNNECHRWGTDIIGHWWTGCAETIGRLDHGGQCPGPQDFSGNYDNEIRNWKDTGDSDKHTEKIDGLCYKKCPADYPVHIPGMPYLCYKGGELSYDRGVGVPPHMLRLLGKYPVL